MPKPTQRQLLLAAMQRHGLFPSRGGKKDRETAVSRMTKLVAANVSEKESIAALNGTEKGVEL